MAYMIKQTYSDGDTDYLNHAYMSSLSFGSLDMAWMTDDKEKADLMLFKVEAKKGNVESTFEVAEW